MWGFFWCFCSFARIDTNFIHHPLKNITAIMFIWHFINLSNFISYFKIGLWSSPYPLFKQLRGICITFSYCIMMYLYRYWNNFIICMRWDEHVPAASWYNEQLVQCPDMWKAEKESLTKKHDWDTTHRFYMSFLVGGN